MEPQSLIPSGTFIEPQAMDSLRSDWIAELRRRIDFDFAGLVNDLYRFDLEEARFHEALLSDDPATFLFEALLQRMHQKLRFRQLYRET